MVKIMSAHDVIMGLSWTPGWTGRLIWMEIRLHVHMSYLRLWSLGGGATRRKSNSECHKFPIRYSAILCSFSLRLDWHFIFLSWWPMHKRKGPAAITAKVSAMEWRVLWWCGVKGKLLRHHYSAMRTAGRDDVHPIQTKPMSSLSRPITSQRLKASKLNVIATFPFCII